MSERLVGRPAEPDECRHADAVALGFDGSAEFTQCTACGEVLVRQRGRQWAIRPAPSG